MWTKATSAPAKTRPARQQAAASRRDPRHVAIVPMARRSAIAGIVSRGASGTNLARRIPRASAANGPRSGCSTGQIVPVSTSGRGTFPVLKRKQKHALDLIWHDGRGGGFGAIGRQAAIAERARRDRDLSRKERHSLDAR